MATTKTQKKQTIETTNNDVSIIPVLKELEKMYDFINKEFFESKLSKVVITLVPDTKNKMYGWFRTGKVWSVNEERYNELNICADHLNRLNSEVLETLFHEMIHAYNYENGIKDTSRSGNYHNVKFKEACDKFGLKCELVDNYGYAKTALTPEIVGKLCSVFDGWGEVFYTPITKPKTVSRQSTRKYSCPCCNNIVRATKEVRLWCPDCEIMYVEN